MANNNKVCDVYFLNPRLETDIISYEEIAENLWDFLLEVDGQQVILAGLTINNVQGNRIELACAELHHTAGDISESQICPHCASPKSASVCSHLTENKQNIIENIVTGELAVQLLHEWYEHHALNVKTIANEIRPQIRTLYIGQNQKEAIHFFVFNKEVCCFVDSLTGDEASPPLVFRIYEEGGSPSLALEMMSPGILEAVAQLTLEFFENHIGDVEEISPDVDLTTLFRRHGRL